MEKESLALILPVYNEGEIINSVLNSWYTILDSLNIDFRIDIYDDGSRDNSLEIIHQFEEEHKNINVYSHKNIGHGPTLVNAYKNAKNIDWVFQADSDNELSPSNFIQFWHNRKSYDLIIGQIVSSERSIFRKIISFFAKLFMNLFFRSGVHSVNIPFRLMRCSKFERSFCCLPSNLNIPNIILSGLASQHKMRIKQMPIELENRKTGKSLQRQVKLIKTMIAAGYHLIAFRIKYCFSPKSTNNRSRI